MTLDDLIALLEKAEGPCRKLDAEIAVALRIPPSGSHNNEWARKNFPVWRAGDGKVVCIHDDGSSGPFWVVLEHTSSIDAALTLVPEGWRWAVNYDPDRGPQYAAAVKRSGDDWPRVFDMARSPAIALCVAALKARKEQP